MSLRETVGLMFQYGVNLHQDSTRLLYESCFNRLSVMPESLALLKLPLYSKCLGRLFYSDG